MRETATPKGLPGGIALPALFFVASFALFVHAFLEPGAIQLPYSSAAGVGVLGMAASSFWLLFAIGKRPPPKAR